MNTIYILVLFIPGTAVMPNTYTTLAKCEEAGRSHVRHYELKPGHVYLPKANRFECIEVVP